MKNPNSWLAWIREYNKNDIKGDLSAGLTVAVMLIPQGMAYALLAGLPPIIGLYASVASLVLYALIGTSKQLAVGPVALISLMVAAGLQSLPNLNTETYILFAALLAGLVGLIQLGMGVFRLGFLVNFLSHPVISGFTSAAALIIGFSQLKHILGISILSSHRIDHIIIQSLENISSFNIYSVIIGIAAILILILIKKWKPLFPGALLVVILSTAAVWFFGLDQMGVKIVGNVPQGLPLPSLAPLKHLNMNTISELLPMAIAISLVGFMESIAVAKSFAGKNKYKIDANKELIGLGAGNLASSLFTGYPVTGGFSRTAVNDQAGAKTPLASLITAAFISLTLIFLTPLFYYLPQAVLGAVIITAVFSLIDTKEVHHLFKVKKQDLFLLIFAFFATLILGMEWGILTSVVLSLLFVLHRSFKPHFALLGRIPGTKLFKNIRRHPEAHEIEGLLIFRLDSDLYFANIDYLQDKINHFIQTAKHSPRAVLLDFNSINNIDSTADKHLHEMTSALVSEGIKLYLSNVKDAVKDVMRLSGFCIHLGNRFFFHTNKEAVEYFQSEIKSNEKINS